LGFLDKIKQRQIYWLDNCVPLDGVDEKRRPVIVLSPPAHLCAKAEVLVVGCTCHPRDKDHPRFAIPSRHKAPETGLPQECWALPRWYLPINRFRLKDLAGKCPDASFDAIIKAVDEQMEHDAQEHPGEI
jgi:hypothetical protein